jgi:hypothetical protein
MPLAAVRARDLAFLVSISGAGVPPAETTIDQAQNEMTARGMKPQTVPEIVALMKLQYRFAQTGQGWDDYASARETLASRMGQPPETFPATPEHPSWQSIRRFYFYDPAPVIRQLQAPILALFGELDNNILAEKNKAAWETALKAGANRDYTLLIVAKANHSMFEATWDERRDAVIATVRPRLLHDDPRLAWQTYPRRRRLGAAIGGSRTAARATAWTPDGGGSPPTSAVWKPAGRFVSRSAVIARGSSHPRLRAAPRTHT